MARSSRNKKPKPQLIEQCVDIRQRMDRCTVRYQQATQQSQRTVEQAASELIAHLDLQLTELLETENAWAEKSQQLSDRETEVTKALADLESRRKDAAVESTAISEQQRLLGEMLQKSSVDLNETLSRISADQTKLAADRRDFERSRDEFAARNAELSAQQRALDSRREALDAESQRLQEERELLEQKAARTSAQRRLIAGQLRARHSELLRDAGSNADERQSEAMAISQRELQLARETLESLRDENLRLRGVNSDDDVAATEHLAQIESRLQQRAEECEVLSKELVDARNQIELLQKEIQNTLQQSQDANDSQVATLSDQLAEAQLRLEQALSDTDARRQAASATEAQLEASLEKLELVENELARVRDLNNESDSDLRNAMVDLRGELDEASQRVEELELQNRDLASKLASRQVSGAGTSHQASVESMTWEERKAHMLQQLDAEDKGEPSTELAQQTIEIHDIIERTDREVARRDSEIAELRCLLEQQTTASGDVAIGGAAILQMLDQDELIVQERAKLQRIQTEWEEKLRQAEIDVSLERAKLARERIELEQRLADLRDASQIESEVETKGRKWLARLGLTDDE